MNMIALECLFSYKRQHKELVYTLTPPSSLNFEEITPSAAGRMHLIGYTDFRSPCLRTWLEKWIKQMIISMADCEHFPIRQAMTCTYNWVSLEVCWRTAHKSCKSVSHFLFSPRYSSDITTECAVCQSQILPKNERNGTLVNWWTLQ